MKILFFIFSISLLLLACTTQSTGTVVYDTQNPVQENKVVKEFDVRLHDSFVEPPVMVVDEGDIVKLTFFFEDPVFVSLGDYVNDYYTTGQAAFTADASGEFTISCKSCDDDNAILGFLDVR
ncbi:hypothetical protein C4573_01865 [Candidatus Woesearchaeota archaeon]|nr:MAG: hypothetical protein C4573_01865 [Candidatus Woesearchaeota archaeon]